MRVKWDEHSFWPTIPAGSGEVYGVSSYIDGPFFVVWNDSKQEFQSIKVSQCKPESPVMFYPTTPFGTKV